jgi:hypothetical protein
MASLEYITGALLLVLLYFIKSLSSCNENAQLIIDTFYHICLRFLKECVITSLVVGAGFHARPPMIAYMWGGIEIAPYVSLFCKYIINLKNNF